MTRPPVPDVHRLAPLTAIRDALVEASFDPTADPDEIARTLQRTLVRDHGLNPLEDPEDYPATQTWTFARTMADDPHWYVTLARSTMRSAHLAFLDHIRAHGRPERWQSTTYLYLDLDDFTYWGVRPTDTIINRRERT